MMSPTDKIIALEDIAWQFRRISDDLLSILCEDISDIQKVEAVEKYFKTLLFTSTITEATSFMHDDEDTHKMHSVK